MAYEKDIDAMYNEKEMTPLQKAALHFVEFGFEEKELDYAKYIASYDDLSAGALSSKPADQELVDWLPVVGKMHYESSGKTEIQLGIRPLTPFFNALMYVASYPQCKDAFMTAEGLIDETIAIATFVGYGLPMGLARNAFAPFAYLANSPDAVSEDIYDNGKVDKEKVAQMWIKNWSSVDLSSFDPTTFSISKGLEDGADAFEAFVNEKVEEYQVHLKNQRTIWNRIKKSVPTFSIGCGSKAAVQEDAPEES